MLNLGLSMLYGALDGLRVDGTPVSSEILEEIIREIEEDPLVETSGPVCRALPD